MKDSLQTIIYATALGLVCSLMLTAAATYTAPYKKSNAKAEKMRGILSVLEVPFPADASSQDLVDIYDKNIRQEESGELTLYKYIPDGSDKTEAVAVAFAGPGLWGPIKGFLSLESDMKTIRGIIFHEQEETPGLGGDIVTESFRGQFKGKSIADANGKPGMRLVRDGADAINEVDAITGATITCNKVEQMLNKTIALIMKER